MSEQLTDQQIEELKEAFDVIDKKHTGIINVKELPNLLKYIGHNPSEEKIKVLIAQVDAGGTGSVDFPEFLAYVAKRQKEILNDTEELIDAMSVFDKEESGLLDKEVLEFALLNMGDGLSESEMKELLETIPYDETGKVNYQDFLRFLVNESEKK